MFPNPKEKNHYKDVDTYWYRAAVPKFTLYKKWENLMKSYKEQVASKHCDCET